MMANSASDPHVQDHTTTTWPNSMEYGSSHLPSSETEAYHQDMSNLPGSSSLAAA